MNHSPSGRWRSPICLSFFCGGICVNVLYINMNHFDLSLRLKKVWQCLLHMSLSSCCHDRAQSVPWDYLIVSHWLAMFNIIFNSSCASFSPCLQLLYLQGWISNDKENNEWGRGLEDILSKASPSPNMQPQTPNVQTHHSIPLASFETQRKPNQQIHTY